LYHPELDQLTSLSMGQALPCPVDSRSSHNWPLVRSHQTRRRRKR